MYSIVLKYLLSSILRKVKNNLLPAILVTIWLLIPLCIHSQPPKDTLKLKIDLPLFDFPYQKKAMDAVGSGFFGSYANPSMSQSLAVSTGVYSSFHFGMKHFYENSNIRNRLVRRLIYDWGTLAGDLLLLYLPGGEAWLHEEYHRAVMSRHGANSFNGVNRFPVGSSIIAVSKVKDEDLMRIKEKSPSDMVRLHASGIEGQYLLINNLQRNNFFYDLQLNNQALYLISTFNSHLYIFMSTSPKFADKNMTKMNEKETTIASRDFTGFDFTAWAYERF